MGNSAVAALKITNYSKLRAIIQVYNAGMDSSTYLVKPGEFMETDGNVNVGSYITSFEISRPKSEGKGITLVPSKKDTCCGCRRPWLVMLRTTKQSGTGRMCYELDIYDDGGKKIDIINKSDSNVIIGVGTGRVILGAGSSVEVDNVEEIIVPGDAKLRADSFDFGKGRTKEPTSMERSASTIGKQRVGEYVRMVVTN